MMPLSATSAALSASPVLTACLVLSLLAVVLGPALWRSRRKKACVRTAGISVIVPRPHG